MWTFRVWAPKPKRVDVRLGNHDHAMSRDDHGWWTAEIADACPGDDYFFVLDSERAIPDPRSAWQPAGVHGPSRVVNQSEFRWTDNGYQPTPLRSAIIYELHIGTFTPDGTFDSAIERLSYLKDLGVTHVELMPVNEFSGDWGWGYDGVDLYAPHHAYGGPDALKRFVDACHRHGLAVLLDVVYNHLGPTGNYLSQFGPYFTNHYSTPWGEAVNLDGAGSREVRCFFIDNARMWLRDYHFDGLRLDAVHALVDTSATHLLEQLAAEVREVEASTGRNKVLIAESDGNDPRVVRTPEIGGYGMDAQWSDDFHHALHAALTGETLGYYEDFGGAQKIVEALQHTFIYRGSFSKHRDRVHGREPIGVSSRRFLGYIQTHDQVGNRAGGERISHLTSFGKARIAAALVLTSPFVPMLFAGEEFAASTPFQYFTHHEEESLAKAVSEGRKREFQAFGWKPEDVPDPQDPDTFQRSKIRWEELGSEDHRSMLHWYRELIRLRKTCSDLATDRQKNMAAKYHQGVLSVTRGNIRLFCNLEPTTQSVSFEFANDILLASDVGFRQESDRWILPGESALLVKTATSDVQSYSSR